jgi:hypothetical protein
MHVFIDESGSFSGYQAGSVSVVAALCIPDGMLKKITKKYERMRKSLPTYKGEVKGRLLSENQVQKVVELLAHNMAILEVSVIDIGIHTEQGVISYRDQLADEMEGRLSRFREDARAEVKNAVEQIRKTPPPLFLQAITMWDVLDHVICHIPLYFVQRRPRELGVFKWVVDAKDTGGNTNWENWWSTYCQGALANKSKNNPAPALEGANYSYFEKFEVTTPEGESGTDLKLLLSDISFSSNSEHGLELVDILVNAIRRAIIGNLKFEGWKNIPNLMIHRNQHYISLVRLEEASTEPKNPTYVNVINHFKSGGKNMMTRNIIALVD